MHQKQAAYVFTVIRRNFRNNHRVLNVNEKIWVNCCRKCLRKVMRLNYEIAQNKIREQNVLKYLDAPGSYDRRDLRMLQKQYCAWLRIHPLDRRASLSMKEPHETNFQ